MKKEAINPTTFGSLRITNQRKRGMREPSRMARERSCRTIRESEGAVLPGNG
jgi:hypothetical protein